jgi:hypothetical protein
MKKFRSIELGSAVAFYSNAGLKRIENSEHVYNGITAFRSRKMYSAIPNSFGVVVKIKGHNANACRVFLDNGQEVEIGLDTHYHLNNEIGECISH